MTVHPRLPILRRWTLLTLAGGLGMVGFWPVILTDSPDAAVLDLLILVGVATAIDAVCAWLGLRWADGAGLPMPWLRAWEMGDRPPVSGATPAALAIGGGVAFGVAAALVLRVFGVPNMSGSFLARVATTLFGAVTIEIVLHLAIMSGVVRLTRSVWAGIAVSSVAFMLFHGAGTFGMEPALTVTSLAMNGLFAVFFGWLYARHGFEWLVVAHAVGHAIAVGAG